MDNNENKEEENNNEENIFENKHIEKLQELNFFNLIKSEELIYKKEALDILIEYFNEIDSFNNKYEVLINISKNIFPLILNISVPSLSHVKNIKNIELYIKFGEFLLQFLFNKEYILDFSDFKENEDKLSKKYPCLLFHNKSELIDISELNNKKYKLLQYDILKNHYKTLIDIYINYFIKQMIIYDTNFEMQNILFEMLKYFYFLCDENNSKDILMKYISEVLNNLSQFKKQSDFENSSNSREFGYYLLLNEKNFKSLDNSITMSPQNEYDVYITKFNMAKDLMKNALYIKKNIEQGKKFEILKNLNKKNSIIYLELYIEDNKEISLTIYKKNEIDKNFEQIGFNNIIKTVKINENNYKIAKIIIVNSSNNLKNYNQLNYSNQFKIQFDNYDSWFTNRTIHYSLAIFENIED